MVERVERLELYEPKTIVPMEIRSAGSEIQPLQLAGNSLLSLVYIHAVDPGATLKVEYFDSGAGTSLGEFNLIGEHPLLTAPTSPASRILITRLTNKTNLKWTVTGGDVYFGVYAYVVASFASDLDNALQLHDSVTDLANDKGLMAMCYDAAAGKSFFLPCEDGAVKVTGLLSTGEAGTPFFLDASEDADPGNTVTVFSSTVPAGTTRNLKRLFVTAINDGDFSLKLDGLEVASGRIDVVQHNISFVFDPPRPVGTGTLIELKYTSDTEPTHVCPVKAFLSANDVT